MKKFLFYFLEIIILSVFIISCSKTNSNNGIGNQQSSLTSDTSTIIFPHLLYQIPTGSVADEFVVPNASNLSDFLLTEGFFDSVLTTNLEYQYDSSKLNYNAYVTLIGEKGGKSLSYQFTLLVDSVTRNTYIQYPVYVPNSDANTINVHECSGNNCSSCAFLKEKGENQDKGKIIGCKCNIGSGSCDHSMKGGIDINKVIELATKLIGLFG